MSGIPECNAGSFSCKTINFGFACIRNTWRCDGKEHCVDGFDEQNCTGCNPVLFQCSDPPHLECIPTLWRCDGNPDCELGVDEKDCNHATQQKAPQATSSTLESLLTTTEQTTTTPSTTTTTTTATTAPSYSRRYVYVRRDQSTRPTEDFDTGSNGTFVKNSQAKTENEFKSIVQSVLKSPYFVYGLLATVVILAFFLVVVCVVKGRRKKRRRRGELPAIPSQERRKLISGSSSGTSATLSSTTGSSFATKIDYPDSHYYEDIEKYRPSVLLLAQTGMQQWGTDYPENVTVDNSDFETTDWTDNNSRRSSSYAAVMQFKNGQPSALSYLYEQPLKCQEQQELGNEYLSIQEVFVLEDACSGYEEPVSRKSDKEFKGKSSDCKKQDVPVLEDICSGYEEPMSMKSDKEGKGKCSDFNGKCVKNLNSELGLQSEYHSIHEVSVTESISTGYEEPVRKASYKHDTNNKTDTRGKHANVPVPLALHSEPCSIHMKSAKQDACDNDYLRPITDDYIHPV